MKKQGISLIVLVITIVVIIILAAAVILSLGQNNPISSSRVASTSSTKDSIESSILVYIANVQAKTLGELSTEEILITDSTHKIVSGTSKSITKDGVTTSLSAIDSTLSNSKLNFEVKNEGSGVWCIDKYGKAYLVYENIDSVPAYFKDGENISSSVSNFVVINGGTITSGGSSTPVTPTTYTITYNANGGSGEMSDTTGASVTVASNTFIAPSNTNFKCWNTAADGSGTKYFKGETVSQDLTLYAIWGTFALGDEVRINNETFWVIANSTASEPNVTLITKENINTTTRTQTSANTVAFSESVYWWDSTNNKIKDEYNTENGLNVDIGSIQSTDNKYVLYAAQEYGKKLGGTGRLLLKSEADALKTSNSALLYANSGDYKASGNFLNYWLGSARVGVGLSNNVWIVYGKGSFVDSYDFDDLSRGFGVRPVVTISKSNI